MTNVFLCKAESIGEGSVQIHRVNEVDIALIRESGALYAYRNVCPHQGGPVCEGRRRPRVVENIDDSGNYLGKQFDETDMLIVCPWHGYSFNLKSGVNISDARLKLHQYKVLEKDDNVYVVI